MTLPQIELVEAAYAKATEDNPQLSSVGFSRLSLPPSIKRTAAKKVLALLKKGVKPDEIASAAGASRQRSVAKKTVARAAIKKVKNVSGSIFPGKKPVF